MILSSSARCKRCEVERCEVRGEEVRGARFALSARAMYMRTHFTTRGEHIVCLEMSSLSQGAARCFSCGGAASTRAHGWHQAAARSGPPSTNPPRSSPSPRPYRPAGFSVGRGAREQVLTPSLTAPTGTWRSAAAQRSRAPCTGGTRARCGPPHTAQSRRRCQGAGPGAADQAPMPSRTRVTVLGRSCPRCAGGVHTAP